MNFSELKTALAELLAGADSERTTEIATQITDYFAQVDTTVTETTATLEKLTADNESLRKANMALFLRVGETLTPTTTEDDTPPATDDETTEQTFESLFDENGGLK